MGGSPRGEDPEAGGRGGAGADGGEGEVMKSHLAVEVGAGDGPLQCVCRGRNTRVGMIAVVVVTAVVLGSVLPGGWFKDASPKADAPVRAAAPAEATALPAATHDHDHEHDHGHDHEHKHEHKFVTAGWCATYANTECWAPVEGADPQCEGVEMQNECMEEALDGFDQVSMGYMASKIFDPFPPSDDQAARDITCSDGPMCPSGGRTNIWSPPGKCPVVASKKYITLGGDGLGTCGEPLGAEVLTGLVNAQDANGVDLDLEGCMECKDTWQGTAANAKSAGLAVQITPFGSAADDGVVLPWLLNNPDKWDSVALMLYGSSMMGDGWEVCCCSATEAPTAAAPCGKTYAHIKKWLDSGLPKHKILLGVTVVGLERYMVDFFADIVATHKLGGMAYWKASTAPAMGLMPSYDAHIGPAPACPPAGPMCAA